MTTEPNSAVSPPTMANRSSDGTESAITSPKRSTRKPPALMMPACSSAETGVGVSITSSSQPWKGSWADFSSAPAASSTAIQGLAAGIRPAADKPLAAGRIVAKSIAPNERQSPDQTDVAQAADQELLARGEPCRRPIGVE